jgi:2-oxo-4-hydroxy-4-carboxy-5-ureidoimidazoline decarboxylase
MSQPVPDPLPDALVQRLNRQDEAGFVREVGALYEHSPWVAVLAFRHRPFADRNALCDRMQQVVRDAPRAQQLALIRAHPDLAGRLARAGALAAHSTGEQSGLGLDRLSDAEYERFDRLNNAYRARFGMPFVIAVRAQTRQSVLAAFEARLQHDPETEIATAIEEIGRIAAFRLADLV